MCTWITRTEKSRKVARFVPVDHLLGEVKSCCVSIQVKKEEAGASSFLSPSPFVIGILSDLPKSRYDFWRMAKIRS